MSPFLKSNPEFARNIWLEFSPQRLIVMPFVILLITMLVLFSTENTTWNPNHVVEAVSGTGMGMFIFITMIWGLKSASDAILEEYNDKTWDWQRMTVIGPWKLAWGKLFGSTIYQWYGGAICLVVYFLAALAGPNPGKLIKYGILAIIAAIVLHAFVLLLSLLMMKKGDGRAKIRSATVFIVGLFAVGCISSILGDDFRYDYNRPDPMRWFGIQGIDNIMIITFLFYGSWIVAGLYRSLRAELQYSDKPTFWIGFLVTNLIFVMGYMANNHSLTAHGKLAVTFIICGAQTVGITYFLALIEPKDIVNFRFLTEKARERQWDDFWRNIPLWPVTLLVALAIGFIGVLLSLKGIESDTSSYYNGYNGHEYYQNHPFEKEANFMIKHGGITVIFLYLAIVGFIIRDLGILLLLNLSQRTRRADGAMVLYLAILYIVMPLFTKNHGIGAVFYPDISIGGLVMAFIPILEATIVFIFLRKQWYELQNSIQHV